MAYYKIVMSGSHGEEEVDSYLTRDEARATVKEYRISDRYNSYRMARQFRARFYVKPCGGSSTPAAHLIDHVKRLGSPAPFNVRTALLNGQSNLPSVVTFSAWDHEAKFVEKHLREMGYMVLVMEKDW